MIGLLVARRTERIEKLAVLLETRFVLRRREVIFQRLQIVRHSLLGHRGVVGRAGVDEENPSGQVRAESFADQSCLLFPLTKAP